MGVLTALYFAVSEDRQDQPASLWDLNPVELNWRMTKNQSIGVLQHDEREIQELIIIAFQRYSERPNLGDRVLAMSGPELDLRMLVQWGVFTIHATNTPIEQLPNYRDVAAEISIPAQDRRPLRQALRIAGFLVRDFFLIYHLSQRTSGTHIDIRIDNCGAIAFVEPVIGLTSRWCALNVTVC